ncbi:MAG: putative PEP-binding protein [Bacillota bacterium]|nr:putative PEP-binding protein [Bacillota bacterium]
MDIVSCKTFDSKVIAGHTGVDILTDVDDISNLMRYKNTISGVITDEKGLLSHSVIFLKQMCASIAVVENDILSRIRNSESLIIDGRRHVIIINPDESLMNSVINKVRQPLDINNITTSDGIKISLSASVLTYKDIIEATDKFPVDIGMWRSEGILIGGEDEEKSYRSAFDRCRKINVRLFDVTGDKTELCKNISQDELCEMQIKKLIDAAQGRMFNIIIPNVEDEKDILNVKPMFRGNVGFGAMIETPSAVILCDDIMRHCAFVNIGFNGLMREFKSTRAAVKAAQRVALASRKTGIPAVACGIKLCDPAFLKLVIGAGITKFCLPETDFNDFAAAAKSISYTEAVIQTSSFLGSYYAALA